MAEKIKVKLISITYPNNETKKILQTEEYDKGEAFWLQIVTQKNDGQQASFKSENGSK